MPNLSLISIKNLFAVFLNECYLCNSTNLIFFFIGIILVLFTHYVLNSDRVNQPKYQLDKVNFFLLMLIHGMGYISISCSLAFPINIYS